MSQPGHDASKVRASGPGLDTKGVSASLPVEFTIDARDAGEGLLTVQILVRADMLVMEPYLNLSGGDGRKRHQISVNHKYLLRGTSS